MSAASEIAHAQAWAQLPGAWGRLTHAPSPARLSLADPFQRLHPNPNPTAEGQPMATPSQPYRRRPSPPVNWLPPRISGATHCHPWKKVLPASKVLRHPHPKSETLTLPPSSMSRFCDLRLRLPGRDSGQGGSATRSLHPSDRSRRWAGQAHGLRSGTRTGAPAGPACADN